MIDDDALETDEHLTILTEHIFVILSMGGTFLGRTTRFNISLNYVLDRYDLMTFEEQLQPFVANVALVTHGYIACNAKSDGLYLDVADSALLPHLQYRTAPSRPGAVVVHESVDRHIGEEIVDPVCGQLRHCPAERADHVIKILVG